MSDLAQENFDTNKELLNPSDDSKEAFIEHKKRREPNTCTWIFEQKQYGNWCESVESGLLWVSGGGGG